MLEMLSLHCLAEFHVELSFPVSVFCELGHTFIFLCCSLRLKKAQNEAVCSKKFYTC